MEAEGVLRIRHRSESRLGLRYTRIISDGDSKAIAALRDSRPYGETQVVKHECVGCVQKRVGGYLRDLKKDKMLKDADDERSKFSHRLIDASIDKLPKYYVNAIRANVGNVKAMEHACWVVFYHSYSHDGEPQHEYCPVGPDTWCPYIRAIYESRDLSHAKPPRILADLAPFVKVCWDKLCNRELLKHCKLGEIQNKNESFNNLIRKYCPKMDFSSLLSV